ncbi:MAG: holo-ACP synthase [Gammaproteobacteria bacterium]|nr:holo-ACP synthase [Gammaproteobacteria bacterium]
MISGIGVDIAETQRFTALYHQYGDRFAKRILTPHEQNQLKQRSHPDRFLASRFAAKEAAVKALGTGFNHGVGYKSIEVKNDSFGKPELVFYREALNIIRDRKISSAHISISDEKQYVVAMVVIESL